MPGREERAGGALESGVSVIGPLMERLSVFKADGAVGKLRMGLFPDPQKKHDVDFPRIAVASFQGSAGFLCVSANQLQSSWVSK